MSPSESRPSPEALLRAARREARGKLKIFLGAAPGVGKTFEMLREGAERLKSGVDVVVAVAETHGRAETKALLEPFEIIPRRQIDYRGHALGEMDLDALLVRQPELALVDELAHTNVEGSRHPKRWQDVMELLDAGIDIYTTLNVQHVESLNDVVASFTKVRVRETVPDSVFDGAEIEVVDLPPDELIERLKEGKVYIPDEASRALGHFFSKPNLSALREMALRRAALSVDRALLDDLDAGAVVGSYAGGERVLVAVSELPGSDTIVRAAKRLADALRAPWQAVYIETPRAQSFSEDQKHAVADALRLAANLGATIATVPSESVIEGLTSQVQQTRATQLVLGKSVRSWWFEVRHGSVVNAMLRAGEGLAVHVIPASPDAPPSRKSPGVSGRWGKSSDYLAIAGLIAGTTAVGKLVEPLIGLGGVDLVYLLPVILASGRFGLRPGLVAGVVSALAYNFFFLPPIYTFTIAAPQSLLTMFVLIAVGAFTANLAGRLKARASLGARSAQENAAVAAFGQMLARTSDWKSTSELVCNEIARLLQLNVLVLNDDAGKLHIVATTLNVDELSPIDMAAAEWTWARGEAAGAGTGTLNAADWQFQPLKTSLGVLAVVGLSREDGQDPVSADRVLLLQTLLGQAALAHERLKLEAEVREITVLKERDRLRAALLSSIGHDLRTPLTSVSSAIEAIAVEHPGASTLPVARMELARLRRFLDNLLDMVRIDAGALAMHPEPIDLVDAIGSAVHDLKDLFRGRHIDLKVPANLPFVTADPTLLHHILINLLANAAQHGGESGVITIEGKRTPDAVVLSIRDQGPGLAPGNEQRIFETFAQGRGSDRHGGSGLGLAIVKGFAEAMGVKATALNHADGGAEFRLTFGDPISPS
ncbi:sensor histidine kinase KdpD [Croceibacterium sp. LX-88]|uniref:histidine kinase n=1 Tax=Croceibacterium selenioxidans TaxID=2838833 RepID=A0ABS5W4C8_9SPHN|nr:sensor histidine kinase KdpD [Croceibacterium selenioxidans]MBT2134612.1 sensor histidine kinase KdpD [Croceibacterium selenioxidans]